MYDLVIIGAGPAALTAAVYARRYRLDVLVIGKLFGGLISEAYEVCNFPTYEEINGFELSQKMVQQAVKLGTEMKQEEVLEVNKRPDGTFEVVSENDKYEAKTVLIAAGTERRKLNVPGEEEFVGKGVSYCATCDAAFYRGKVVGVVGGSDAALTAALLLAKFAEKVYIIYRRDKFFRAEPAWVEMVEGTENIQPLFNVNVVEILGDEKVKAVKLTDGSELELDGVFVEIGSVPEEKFSKQLGLETENGYIVVDKNQKTNVEGIYAAGDVTNNPLKQAVTACSEGAVAAYTAYNFLSQGR